MPLAANGLEPVPQGTIATIVTSLEMRERPPLRPLPSSSFQLKRWKQPATERYRALFRRVGEPWLWFSRLVMAEEKLRAILDADTTEIYAVVDRQDVEIGLIELDFSRPPDCELSFFGLVPELAGQGHGRWMMAQVMALAWRPGITQLWVHSCTLDHPHALGFYRKSGFRPFAQAVETFPDPRLTGYLPRSAAPQIPLIEGAGASPESCA